MDYNLSFGPGITIGQGITITISDYQPGGEWDYSGDLMSLSGAVDLQAETGTVDLNN